MTNLTDLIVQIELLPSTPVEGREHLRRGHESSSSKAYSPSPRSRHLHDPIGTRFIIFLALLVFEKHDLGTAHFINIWISINNTPESDHLAYTYHVCMND